MKRGHILLLVALLGIPTLCSIALIADPGIAKAARERRQADTLQRDRQQQARIGYEVSSCAENENPWRCFAYFDQQDAVNPVASGASRTERFAAIVPAREVLAFCLEWRKADCADQMIGKGWSRADLVAAMEGQARVLPNPVPEEDVQ